MLISLFGSMKLNPSQSSTSDIGVTSDIGGSEDRRRLFSLGVLMGDNSVCVLQSLSSVH